MGQNGADVVVREAGLQNLTRCHTSWASLSAVLSPLTMTTPPDCSAVHMLMMGAMPMVVPWKYTPLQESGEGGEETQSHPSVPRYLPVIFSFVLLPISNKDPVSAPHICRSKAMKSPDGLCRLS